MTAVERFWAKVERGLSDECWPWTAATSTGYGRFELDGRRGHERQVAAHRFAYETLIGPIPEGLTLDHLCGNSRCVNPAHLRPTTMQENLRRGASPSAANARKTHCKNGHPFDEENTYWHRTPTGMGRKCRACHTERRRKK